MLTSNMEIFLKEIFNMEDLDKDIVVFNDEEGNEIELEVVDYFDYENEEYAVMIDPAAVDDDVRDLFVFRIQVNGDYEEFLPADEDKMDILSKIVDARLDCDAESCEGCSGCRIDD